MRRYYYVLVGLVTVILGTSTLTYANSWISSLSWNQFNDSGIGPALEPGILSTAWLDTKETAGIVYFIFQSPARIERYDLSSEQWLSDINLSETPTAFSVDGEGLYISFGRRTARFNLDGTDESHLHNTPSDVTQLFSRNQFLYIYYSENLVSINKSTGALIDSKEYFYRMSGIDVAPTLGKAFGRSLGISPSDIVEVVLNDDGTLGNQLDSPYHGDYPSANLTFVFPGEARVADDSGIVYHTNDLSYSNSFAGRFDDLAFYGDLPIVLRDGLLLAYSNTFLETGRYEPNAKPLKIHVKGDLIFSFYEGASGIQIEKISVDLLTPDKPGQPVDPNGLSYNPDVVLITDNENVLLLSRGLLSVFGWSVSDRSYTNTLLLVENPSFMAYSADSDGLFLAYPTGKITKIDLNQLFPPSEDPFVNSPQTPCGLTTAGSYLFVCDPSGAWVSHFTYASDGALISQVEWNYYSTEYIWSKTNAKMYFLRDDTSPNDLLWEEINENGVIGTKNDSPYHSSEGMQHPIRVAPDGSVVILGSGRIYDATTLDQINALSNNIDDAVWLNGALYTLRQFQGDSQLQEWGTNYSVEATRYLSGNPIRMFPVSEGLLVVTLYFEKPYFTLLDNELNVVYESLGHKPLLPIVMNNYCLNFFDDFSNPASGWDVVDDEFVLSEYLNGEYRVLSKNSDFFYPFPSPSCDRENYVVETDARWVGRPGSSYGLIFGITASFDDFYLFDINTDFQMFRLLRFYPGGVDTIVPITSSPAINGGNATNNLKVTRNGAQITLGINGKVLGTWSDGKITGLTGAGIFSDPYSDSPTSDVRFDNFSLTGLPGSSTAQITDGSARATSRSDIQIENRFSEPIGAPWSYLKD